MTQKVKRANLALTKKFRGQLTFIPNTIQAIKNYIVVEKEFTAKKFNKLQNDPICDNFF